MRADKPQDSARNRIKKLIQSSSGSLASPQISIRLGLSQSTVRRFLKELAEAGEIKRTERGLGAKAHEYSK